MKTDRDNESSIRDCNLQQQSPLFRCCFAVISKIFEFALTQSEDEKESYPEDTPYCRPGHRAPHRTHTSLLLACRRAWLEFNHLPMSSATHSFWFFDGPPGTLASARQFSQYFQRMTPRNVETMRHVQLFTSSHWIGGISDSGTFNTLFGYKAFSPKTLTITIRHVDWEDYNSDVPLTFKPDWTRQFLYSPHMARIERFELELETVLHKEDQLTAIVQTLKDMLDLTYIHDAKENDSQTGKPLGWQFKLSETPQKSNWDNPAASGGLDNNQYVVVKMIWNRICLQLEAPGMESQRKADEDEDEEGFELYKKRHVPHPRGGRRSQGKGIQISKTEPISNLDYARMKTSDKWVKELSLLQLKPLPQNSV